MIGAAVAILLWLLPLQVNGLITAAATCLSGYKWTFSSIGQSPCDVAVELASVCAGKSLDLQPLALGFRYPGPTAASQSDCTCSSVFYSLMSACSYCQGRDFFKWSIYKTSCKMVHLKVFNQNIPVGVKVPAYAYQDISVSNTFNVTLAQSSIGDTESTRLPQPSSSTSLGPLSTSPAQSKSGTVNNTPAIVGGVVGGVIALGLIVALIIFLMLHSKQKTQKYNSSFQSPPPGTPGRIYSSDIDPNPSRPLSQKVASDITGSSQGAQNHTPRVMAGTSHYSNMPA